VADQAAGASKPMSRRFVSRANRPPALSADQAARQGRAVQMALKSFAEPAAAIAFLNTDQAGRGRPLDWAIESLAGLGEVEQALAQHAAAR
jgi:hypothetical protein